MVSNSIQLLVGQRLLELVIQIQTGARSPFSHHHGAPALGVVGQKAVHLVDFPTFRSPSAWVARRSSSMRSSTVKLACFRVGGHPNNKLVKDSAGPHNDVQVPQRYRVKAAR